MREVTRGRLRGNQLEPPFRLGWPRRVICGELSRRELATRERAMRVGGQKLDQSSKPYIRDRMSRPFTNRISRLGASGPIQRM